MKKLLALFMAMLSILIAVGCAKETPVDQEVPTQQITQAPTQAPTEVPTPTLVPEETSTPTPDQAPSPVATPEPTKVPEVDFTKFTIMYVSGSTVNVRESASKSSKKITALPINTEVKAYLNEDGWYYVSYDDGAYGYMSADYLKTQPVATPAPTPVITPSPLPDYKPNTNLDINDNVFLDALEYTGYNLKKHREDGNMWVFILGKYKQGLGYLSGLGYDYGKSTGYETNENGKPNIALFKKRGGLVCASYLTYVYFNYLPNVAGIDTSHLTRPEYPCSAQSWRLAAKDWVKKGLSRNISFTATRRSNGTVVFNPSEPIPVGSIVVFKVYGNSDSSAARHVALYAGNAGGYHWLTHVGNERGPEMITVENMGFGSTPEIPVEIITPPISFE